MQSTLDDFETRYKKLWEADKDAYVRRYERAQKPLSSYEADINEYISKQASGNTGSTMLAACSLPWCCLPASPRHCLRLHPVKLQRICWRLLSNLLTVPPPLHAPPLQDQVAHEESSTNARYLLIDCGPLKQTLTALCEAWRAKLTGLLNSIAARELAALHSHITTSLQALAPVPGSLEQLAEAVSLQQRLSEDSPKMVARFEPLR